MNCPSSVCFNGVDYTAGEGEKVARPRRTTILEWIHLVRRNNMSDWQDFWKNTNMEQNRINFLGRKLEAMERKLDFLLKELKIEIPEEPESPYLTEVKAFINQGNKIEAIRVYREKFGATLAEAKSAIEDLERGLRK